MVSESCLNGCFSHCFCCFSVHQGVKQDRYRTALDAQRRESTFIHQTNEEKYDKELAAAGTKMPYGNI